MNTEIDQAYAFKYERPTEERPRTTVWLCRTDRMLADIQVITKGGEARLHSHPHLDGFWMVLSGRVRFTGEGGSVLGEFGPNEGILVPRWYLYAFEAVGSEPVEMIQVEISDVAMPSMDAQRADRNDMVNGKPVLETPADARPATPFKYEMPPADRPKTIVWLARTDRLFADVQVITSGGETNLHSHAHLDGFWFVLSGRARFYGEEHVLLADMGQYEGVLLPRGVPYWFESGSDEPLELLQIEGSDIAMNSQKELTSDRKDYEPPKQRATASYVNAPD